MRSNKGAERKRSGAKTNENKGIHREQHAQTPNPLTANAQKGGAATAHAALAHALMAMHELIAARFPVKAHAQAAQHDHANHAQNRRERILRAICHKHHI